uniref:G-protein coupled receptors family 1 profile domain-containing protein n=1 Tax=Plectus sambesii TaxID=2011161 RepID=A0A914X9Z2_9BILA
MVLWSISFGASFPYAYSIMNLLSYQNVCGNFCEELWPTEIHRRSSSFAIVVLQFALPMAILWYCYGCLRKTFSTSIRRREQYSLTQDSYDRMRRNRSKTSTLTILLCAAFVGPWLPMNIVHIMRDFTLKVLLAS